MALDPNEIGGFIGACANVEYLRSLQGLLRDRLSALGQSPDYVEPVPLSDGVFSDEIRAVPEDQPAKMVVEVPDVKEGTLEPADKPEADKVSDDGA